jgi:cation diffusion facilitator CzcD-associated flavoprotein CzcO
MQSSFAESAVLMQVRKVAVIGAGGSGCVFCDSNSYLIAHSLTAAKCARDDGLEPVIFEQNDISQLGGMWAYDNLPL